jgi:hypothetical protein
VKVVVVAVLAFAVAACGAGGRMGSNGGQGICPAHPEQCGGKCCGDKCVEVARDPFNCGDCNVACPTGTICLGGACGCPPFGDKCSLGQTCCGALGCVSLDSDIRNCGGCGVRCPDGVSCAQGSCAGAVAATVPPPGFCSCSDGCANDPKRACIAANCCYDGFLAGSCTPATSCGMWTYQ